MHLTACIQPNCSEGIGVGEGQPCTVTHLGLASCAVFSLVSTCSASILPSSTETQIQVRGKFMGVFMSCVGKSRHRCLGVSHVSSHVCNSPCPSFRQTSPAGESITAPPSPAPAHTCLEHLPRCSHSILTRGAGEMLWVHVNPSALISFQRA